MNLPGTERMLFFNKENFSYHLENTAGWISILGGKAAELRRQVASLKRDKKRLEVNIRLEHEVRRTNPEEKAPLQKHIDMYVATDPRVVALEEKIAELEYEVDVLEAAFIWPLKDKVKNLETYGSIIRAELSAISQKRS